MTVPESADTEELEAAFAVTADEAEVAVPEVDEQALSASAPTAAFSCEVLSWIVMIQLSQPTL